MKSIKIDWFKLKQDYLQSEFNSVASFLKNKCIKINGFVSRKTKGWKEEKELFSKKLEETTKYKILEKVSETEAQVRSRQAEITKNVQLKASNYLYQNNFKSPSEATRALEISLREERKALGIDREQVDMGYEPAFMKTRFAQKLREATPEQLIGILTELKRFDEIDKTT